MKKAMYISFCLTVACSSERLGTCDIEKQVTFRDISFQFPITANDVLKFSDKIVFNRKNNLIQTDSITKNTSAIWFFSSYENKFYVTDSINFFKDALIYGVTFMLWAEIDKTDAQFIEELQRRYPGPYEYVNQFGSQYYIHRRGCLTIIYKREPYYEKPFPSISFCYGFDQMQEQYFGQKTGNIARFD